jgi:hypothetical protein
MNDMGPAVLGSTIRKRPETFTEIKLIPSTAGNLFATLAGQG